MSVTKSVLSMSDDEEDRQGHSTHRHRACKASGNRKFYDLKVGPGTPTVNQSVSPESFRLKTEPLGRENPEVFDFIRTNIIGRNTVFRGPYGTRKLLYCDYVASGQALEFIEDYIRNEVLPCYGNTHTTTTVTSLQTTLFRHEARDIIRNAVRAGEKDAVIFTGSGTTGAVHKLINALKPLFRKQPPYVFVGPFEHHSDLLPWRELGGTVVRIKETRDGVVDLDDLETKLIKSHAPPGTLRIGCFALASNVTGILTPDLAVTSLLHKYGALSFWDCAAAAPYVNLNMNPKGPWGVCAKDAMYFSMHKFIGGPETPGILVAKEDLFINRVPEGAGGGTVFFVTEKEHSYLKNIEDREEGGTPPIIQSIRAGLAMRVKEWATTAAIGERENELCRKAFKRWASVEELVILGSRSAPRIPIFSFLVKPKKGLYLHYNFVCAVLNDVFGIQARGGCACAGPYAEDLLGMDIALAEAYEKLLKEDERLDRRTLRRHQEGSHYETLRPGFSRLNLAYFLDDDEVDFILDAVSVVAEQAWKLLPFYKFNPETGEWRHTSESIFQDRRWLGSISLKEGGKISYNKPPPCGAMDLPPASYAECLKNGKDIFHDAVKECSRLTLPDQTRLFDDDAHALRWFMLPSEALDLVQSKGASKVATTVPFTPRQYDHYRGQNLDKYVTQVAVATAASVIQSAVEAASAGKKAVATNHCDVKKEEENGCLLEKSARQGRKSQEEDVGAIEAELCCGARNKSSVCERHSKVKRIGINFELAITKGWQSPPKTIYKPTMEALAEFQMIRDGDKVLVCLSGGKDSLSLLHTLHQYQFAASAKGTHFTLGAVTVDPQSSHYDPSPLKPYLKALGVTYFYEEQGIMEQASKVRDLQSICSFCSRMKRGRLYATARREGWNVLALGQHLDDLAESFFMSIFHNGRLRTMKAHYAVREKDLRIIRPFVYVREKDLRVFAEYQGLPIIPENCPGCFDAPKERYRIKQMLAQQEVMFPKLFSSLLSALHPIMAFGRVGVESKIMGTRFTWNKNRKKDGTEETEFSFNMDDEDDPENEEESPPR